MHRIGDVTIETVQCLAETTGATPWWAVPTATLLVGAATAAVAIFSIVKTSSNARAALTEAGVVAGRQIDAATANARRQTQATVISASRQRWIDAVRDDVAALLSEELKHRALKGQSDALTEGTQAWKEMNLHLPALYLLQNRLELRLNPTKPLHTALQAATDTLVGTDDPKQAGAAARAVVVAAKALLKEEWERVKREATGDYPVSSASET